MFSQVALPLAILGALLIYLAAETTQTFRNYGRGLDQEVQEETDRVYSQFIKAATDPHCWESVTCTLTRSFPNHTIFYLLFR